MRKPKVYAIYKGDKFIDVGTAQELYERQNIQKKRIHCLTSPSAHKRNKGNGIIAIIVDENEEVE